MKYLSFDPKINSHHQLKARAPDGEQFVDTNKIVNRIVRLTIETGSLTGKPPIRVANIHDPDSVIASVTVITAILSAVSPHPFPAALLIISNLYATTLLVALNNRINLRVESLRWAASDGSELHDHHNRSKIRFNENIGTGSGGAIGRGDTPDLGDMSSGTLS